MLRIILILLTITYCFAETTGEEDMESVEETVRGFLRGYGGRRLVRALKAEESKAVEESSAESSKKSTEFGRRNEFSERSGLSGTLGDSLSGGALGLGYGSGLSDGYSNNIGLSSGYSNGNSYSGNGGPTNAAIQSKRTYEVVPVHLQQEAAIPQIIEVLPSEQPVKIIFRSVSSPVLVQQIHTPGAPGQVEKTNSEDEPHRVLHEVLRPVIQEVREVIQPYRRVTQEIKPVLEEVHTIVAKGEREQRIASYEAPIALSNGGDYNNGGGYNVGLLKGYDKGAKSAAKSAAAKA